MRIKDLTIERVIEEIDDLKHKPLNWDTVQWYAALMTIKHRLEREEVADVIEHEFHTLSKEDAKEWVSEMKNADGSYGEHWSCMQTKNVMKAHGLHCDEWEFYAVMNALYSDFGPVLAEFGIPDTNTACYAKLAKAWLHDEDAMPHKAMRYYECVVE